MPIERPLSPHLTWYRPQLTSVLSIAHRASGIVLSVGSVLVVWWLVAIGAGGETYRATRTAIASPMGTLALAAWSVAFFYHLTNGVRHLAWDAGFGFELRTAYRSGYAVLAATGLLTAASWLFVIAG
ncbi:MULTISPECIES: succinate dehydrogenase, cytochrome b556 subunit [Sphingosinicellaceae]|uniref:succinate dehydrogenase, cytochrome b556 subunit n=1 Tax=Sphingosinicellaceae TaxID=2820280 RepID=UPI001C1E532A|nr:MULTISPECIES: succinate dehydrogenase, cytochrome b556 subunit [Polymorphobacter]QYE35627.1 succinate dehydrogenase, cytochrome b556 subunit [Polymorphobacter sp. PAMC 29334]UAJ11006.1 succinate dehydrogenase, cytochrome b556 subunit [Polymorphobacter megasporae]